MHLKIYICHNDKGIICTWGCLLCFMSEVASGNRIKKRGKISRRSDHCLWCLGKASE